MNRHPRTLLAVTVLLLPLLAAGAATALSGQGARLADGETGATGGKAVFLAQKCNMCHSVASHDIEATTKSEKMKGPDLSDVGNRHDADWFPGFLKKETELNGKKHGKEVKASDEELAALVGWLAGLKQGS
jgi:cbb3-type cytochrome oxidase cytochrome c subunit